MLGSIDIFIVIIFNSVVLILTTICSSKKKEEEVVSDEAAFNVNVKKTDLEIKETIVGFHARRKVALDIVTKNCDDILENHDYLANLEDKRAPASHKGFDEHIELNRYKDVVCFDKSRVFLKNTENKYIHANKIRDKDCNYIVTQGPMTNTIVDFWTMCLQENVGSIVQLCQFKENEEIHCEKYYPEKEGTTEKYGDFEVKFVVKMVHPIKSVTWIVLEVKNQNNASIVVNHIQVPWWSEKTIPDDPKLTVQLSKWLEDEVPKDRTIVAMCNNGAGRSVTFATIPYAKSFLNRTKKRNMSLVVFMFKFRVYKIPRAMRDPHEFLFLSACLVYSTMIDGLLGEDLVEPFLAQYKHYVLRD